MTPSTTHWSPCFLVIGAMKAASTWLHGCLVRHPELAGPIGEKELHFFDEPSRYRRGVEWYRSLFPEVPDDIGVGESTPSYLHTPGAEARVHECFPDVMLLASLRNPADRAFSHYRYSLQMAGKQSVYDSFEEALDASPDLLEFGRYGSHLTRWLELFPRDRLHLVLVEDIGSDARGVMEGAYRFLGLRDTDFEADIASGRDHVTGTWKVELRRPGLYRAVLRVYNWMARWQSLSRVLRSSGLVRSARSRLRRGSTRMLEDEGVHRMTLLPETRARIIRELEEDIGILERILDRDLGAWRAI